MGESIATVGTVKLQELQLQYHRAEKHLLCIDCLILQKFVIVNWDNFKVQKQGEKIKTILIVEITEIIGLYRGSKDREIYATIWTMKCQKWLQPVTTW